jgi:hypothetical protein
MTTQIRPHKFAFDQFVEVIDEKKHIYGPVVQVKALIDGHVCAAHGTLYYGCVRGNDHYTLCEATLRELPPHAKRKMN